MKKIIVVLLTALLVCTGCSTSKPNEIKDISELKVLSPSGAPALALLDVVNDNVNIVDGSEPLQAAFVNPNPEYELIIAPTNLGTKLASVDNTEYRLLAVVTWGNLYVVGTDESDLTSSDQVFAAFGEVAVPGIIFNDLNNELNIQNEIVYYPSVTEAQASLLSNNANSALLAEPAATATIAKAKQNGLDLSVSYDIQEIWKDKYGSEGYPQASIFVLESYYNENKETIENFVSKISESVEFYSEDSNSEVLINKLNEVGVETFGLPSAEIVSKTISKMNLNIVYANDCEQELKDFLQLFNIEYTTELSVFK